MSIYGTLVGFRAYLAERGLTATGSDSDVTAAAKLLVASEWLDGRYRRQFPGLKVGGRSQVREWPRNGAQDRDGYPIPADTPPVEVEYATYEATVRELNSAGSLTVDFTPSAYRRAAVSGAISVEYAPVISAAEVQTQFQTIDLILAKILCDDDDSWLSGEAAR